jgi:hypothetical protein
MTQSLATMRSLGEQASLIIDQRLESQRHQGNWRACARRECGRALDLVDVDGGLSGSVTFSTAAAISILSWRFTRARR